MNPRIVVQHFRMPVSLRRENVHNPIAVALSDRKTDEMQYCQGCGKSAFDTGSLTLAF
ncbi:hypothetical protein [Enterobacter bugandensis]|uniref:hypothetical protein n=1 Tax=Enterobacter bugandensis TaxID=881260 RepID=UPI0013F4E99A|nr:hypothetical protein [Enterobacter bugandensis]